MKKLLAIILSAVLVLSLVTGVHAESVDSSALEQAVSLLTDLDIAQPPESFSDTITRGDFTSMLVSAIGTGNVQTGSQLPFTDIAPGDSYYASVQTAFSMGIISADTLFNPSRALSYHEVVKMTVCAAGYEFLAKAYGGWPTGYVAAATKLGMLEGIYSDDCTAGTAWVLLYNTLVTPLPEISFVDGEVEYSIDSGICILESVYEFTPVEGIFDGAQFFGGFSGKGVGEGNASVSGTIVKKGDFDTDSFFGLECSAYVDKNNTLRTVYTKEPSGNSLLVLKTSDDVTYDNLTYSYYNSKDDLKTAKISTDCTIVWNGKSINYNEDLMLPEKGSVKLIKINSSQYNVCIIDSYEEYVAGTINSDKVYITDARGTGTAVSFNPDDYVSMSVVDQDGDALEFSQIGKNDILWVAKSLDGQIMNVKVSKEYFAGEYTGNGNENEIFIDGEGYIISGSRNKVLPSSVSRGSIVTVYFNCDGEIAYIGKDTGSGANIAYVVASKVGTGLDGGIMVRLFTQQGKMKEYNMAARFTVNGIGFNSSKEDYAKLPKDEANPNIMKSDLVTYSLNNKNQIVAINYPDDVAATFGGVRVDLFKNAYISKYQTGTETIDQYIRFFEKQQEIVSRSGPRIYFNPYETDQLMVPRSEDFEIAKDTDYKVRSFKDVASGTYLENYDHYGYTFEEDSLYSTILLSVYALTSDVGQIDPTQESYMVTSVSKGYDPDENESIIVELTSRNYKGVKLYATGKVEAFITEKGISKGDIVKIDYLGNKLNGLTLVYKAGEKYLSNSTSMGSTGCSLIDGGSIMTNNEGMASLAGSYNVIGKIYRVDGEVIAVVPNNLSIEGTLTKDQIKTFSTSMLSTLYKYDSKTDEISEIFVENVEDYLSTGVECDTVVVECDGGYLESVFVYE